MTRRYKVAACTIKFCLQTVEGYEAWGSQLWAPNVSGDETFNYCFHAQLMELDGENNEYVTLTPLGRQMLEAMNR